MTQEACLVTLPASALSAKQLPVGVWSPSGLAQAGSSLLPIPLSLLLTASRISHKASLIAVTS